MDEESRILFISEVSRLNPNNTSINLTQEVVTQQSVGEENLLIAGNYAILPRNTAGTFTISQLSFTGISPSAVPCSDNLLEVVSSQEETQAEERVLEEFNTMEIYSSGEE